MASFSPSDDPSSTLTSELQNCAETFGPESASNVPEKFTEMINEAHSLEGHGKLSDAVKCLETALSAAKDTLGIDHSVTLEIMNHLGRAYGNLRRLEDAAEVLQVVLGKRRRLLGSDNAKTLKTASHLAWTYGELGHEAEKEAFVIEHQRLSEKAKLIEDKARTLLGQAEELFEEVLDARLRTLGSDHYDTIQSASNIAWVYGKQGHTAEAIDLFKIVLGERKKLLGEGHSDTLGTINNLAKLYQEGGWLMEAEALYKTLLEAIDSFGEKDPRVVVTQHNIAWIYELQGRTDEAIEILEKLLERAARDIRKEHPQILGSINNLACLYLKKGHTAKALSLHEKLYITRRNVLGEDHSDTMQSWLWICHIQERLGIKEAFLTPTEFVQSIQNNVSNKNGVMHQEEISELASLMDGLQVR